MSLAGMHQLVLQFPAGSLRSFDELVALEDRLADAIGALGDVDGHDAGSGEVNIFILTTRPRDAFEMARSLCVGREGFRAAFRNVTSDEFTIVHPPDATEFRVA